MVSSFDHISDSGFETSLSQLIAHAETQARLHPSLNDRDQRLFWVRAWTQLQRASDAIVFPQNDRKCLEMWQEHCSGYASADIDFGFGQ